MYVYTKLISDSIDNIANLTMYFISRDLIINFIIINKSKELIKASLDGSCVG